MGLTRTSKTVTWTAPTTTTTAAARTTTAAARRREKTTAKRGDQRHDRGNFNNTYHNNLRVDENGLSV